MSQTCGTGGYVGPLPGDPDNSSILSATGQYGGIQLNWTLPAFRPEGVALTKIYRNTTNNFDTAVFQVAVGGNSYFDNLKALPLVAYFYWIQQVSVHGTLLNPIGPANAIPLAFKEELINELRNKVDESFLDSALKSKLDSISFLDGKINQFSATINLESSIISSELASIRGDLLNSVTELNREKALRISAQQSLFASVNDAMVGLNTEIAALTAAAAESASEAAQAEANAILAQSGAVAANAEAVLKSSAAIQAAIDAQLAASGASVASGEAINAASVAIDAKAEAILAKSGAVSAKSEAVLEAGNAKVSASNAATSASTASESAASALTASEVAVSSKNAAGASATAAATSATSASSFATAAESAATASSSSKLAAEAARLGSETAATASIDAKNTAVAKASEAGESASAASLSAITADTKAGAASVSATNAATSATNAAGSASSAATSAGLAATSASAADLSKGAASVSAASAAGSATDAAGSASAASTSAGLAATSATNAGASASAAASSASTASTKATDAGQSAQSANSSALAAETQAGKASTSAGSAATSATNAAGSATSAATSATNAAASANAAGTSASNASNSASSAATSATNAAGSASTASTKASDAATSATAAGGSATAASNKASEAATSATNASNSASAANSAKVAAESAKDLAAGSASSAATSASTASTKASDAATSASAAQLSATTATSKAGEASTSASQASTSATNAAGSASSAATSASTASTAASNANTSASAAATSASTASSKASEAASSATSASTSANTAASKASDASVSASQAATAASNASGAASSAATALSQVRATIRGTSLGLPLDQWDLQGQTLVTITDGIVGSLALRLSGAGGYPNQGNFIPINPGKKYRIKFWAKPSSDAAGLLYFSLQQFVNEQGATGPNNGGRSPYKPSGHNRAQHIAAFGNGWGEYNYVWDSLDWQPGVKFVRPEFLDNYSDAAGYWDIQGFSFHDITDIQEVSSAVQTEALARAQADGTLFAQYTVKVDLNGYVSGYGLASTANNATPTSTFAVRADKFYIASPTGSGFSPEIPFEVYTTPTFINGQSIAPGVYIKDALIRNGQITNAKIGNLIASNNFDGSIDANGNITGDGTAGWAIGKSGKAVFSNVKVRGDVQATSINGAIVGSGALENGALGAEKGYYNPNYVTSSPTVNTWSNTIEVSFTPSTGRPIHGTATFAAKQAKGRNGVEFLLQVMRYSPTAAVGNQERILYGGTEGAPITTSYDGSTVSLTFFDPNPPINVPCIYYVRVKTKYGDDILGASDRTVFLRELTKASSTVEIIDVSGNALPAYNLPVTQKALTIPVESELMTYEESAKGVMAVPFKVLPRASVTGIMALYQRFFDRKADYPGVSFYYASQWNLKQIAAEFAASSECGIYNYIYGLSEFNGFKNNVHYNSRFESWLKIVIRYAGALYARKSWFYEDSVVAGTPNWRLLLHDIDTGIYQSNPTAYAEEAIKRLALFFVAPHYNKTEPMRVDAHNFIESLEYRGESYGPPREDAIWHPKPNQIRYNGPTHWSAFSYTSIVV